MVNLTEIAKGYGIFIGFYIIALILNFIVPIMISTLSTVYTNPNISGSVYVGLMFIWIMGILILPNVYIIRGVTQDTGLNTALEIVIAAAIFVFGIILTVKGWFFIEGLASMATNEFILILYWLAVGIMWFETILGIPAYLIMRAYTR